MSSTTDEMHRVNQRRWDMQAPDWQKLRDGDQRWSRCPQQPELAFGGQALAMIHEFAGDLSGKRACVIGSGDNYAAFALAGMGAAVTSSDISARQLEVAAQRAGMLGLDIEFVRCDAAGLGPLPTAQFDLVCSSNGFWIWIADPGQVFSAVHRVLKPGGYHIFYDIHPFMRPWKDRTAIEMEKPYFETGPFVDREPGSRSYEFHWTLSRLINPLLDAGLILRRIAETPAEDSRFWQDSSYQPGTDPQLLDWRHNPRAGLPVWLTVAAQKS